MSINANRIKVFYRPKQWNSFFLRIKIKQLNAGSVQKRMKLFANLSVFFLLLILLCGKIAHLFPNENFHFEASDAAILSLLFYAIPE